MEPKGLKKLPKWSPKSSQNVKISKFMEKVRTFKNHAIYYGLATCSLCAEVTFPEKIAKQTCQESSLQLLLTKTRKVTKKVPIWSPRRSLNPPFADFRAVCFFILGPFGLLWRPWGSLVAKMDSQDAKMEPRRSQKSHFVTQQHPKRILAVSFSVSFYISFLCSFPSSFSSCYSFSFSLSCSFSLSLSLFISPSLSRSLPSSLSYFSVVLL